MTKVVEFAFLDDAVLADPYGTYRWVLDSDHILKVPGQNVYGVFSASLVDEVLQRFNDFSSDYGSLFAGRHANDSEIRQITDQGCPHLSVLLTTDPPIHTHQRRLVNMAFSKPRVDKMADEIQLIVNRLIDHFIDRGNCEFIKDFAIPLPVNMIAGQYGLSDVPSETVKRWSNAIIDRAGGVVSREREIECARDLLEFQRLMLVRIAARRRQPQNDLLSDLVNARVADVPPLNDDELMAILQQLVTAGNETTTSALGLGMLRFIRNPELAAPIRADASKIPKLVEELLRFDPPVHGTWRITKKAVEIAGIQLPENSMVMVRLASASRDPQIFEMPDGFDPVRRNASRHYAFGKGIHGCIGNMLARREMAIAFEALFSRMQNFTLVDENLSYDFNHMTLGLKRLDIRFDRVVN